MDAYKKNLSSNGCLPQSLIIILGLIFIFFVFLCLFGGDQGAAVIADIIFVICGFITCFLLSVYFEKSWFFWSLSLSLPMIVIGLLFALSLLGGKHVWVDILILSSSGFFVLISSSLGGYVGTIRRRKLKNPGK